MERDGRARETVHHGTKQELQGQADARLPGRARDEGGELAAGGIAADADARGVESKARRIADRRERRGEGVLASGGKFAFGGAGVVDSDDAA